MQNPKDLVIEKLKWVLGETGVSDAAPEVNLVSELRFGDLTTNAAMINAKKIGLSPRELAEHLVAKLQESQDVNDTFENIEVASPGFINFFLSSNYLENLLSEIDQKGQDYGHLDTKNTQKIMVEFGDPNPFKEIHIGHLRNFCIGESYSKLLESQGKEVIRTNYQGDVGLHVAKAIWGIINRLKMKDERLKIETGDLSRGYVEGAQAYEEDENARKEIQNLNKKIYEMVDGEVEDESLQALWEEGRKISLESFERLYQRIGVLYQKFYFESTTAKKGKELVLNHIDDGVFEKSDGAVVFRGEKEGLHTRVFLTSQNYATYEGKDLALAILKNEDESPNESVILTGNEQLEYFQVMLAALRKIAPEAAEKTRHFTFGHVRLKEGKMSSRTGDVIAAQWLLDEAVSRVLKAFPEMDKNTAEKVGVGAVKYSMLKFSIPSDIHFSFEESISLEGNSGPYLQYSFVRTQSVLEKAGQTQNSEFRIQNLEKEEEELLRFLAQFPYILAQAESEFAPNLLCNYLFELSQKFNLFYQKHKIIGSKNEEFRLQLTKSAGQVLQNGLNILGIETVEKM